MGFRGVISACSHG